MNEAVSSHQKLPKPLHLFASLLLVIFVLETLIMIFLPFVLPDTTTYLGDFTDSFLLAVLSAPFIWWLVARPLRNLAMAEFTRTKAVLGSIADAVISFDEDGTIESLNPAA